jgi:tetratricopeptide (TPR) repeat protein
MSRTPIHALTLLAAFAVPGLVSAQTTPPNPPCTKSDKPSGSTQEKGQSANAPCTPETSEPPAARRFPFPGESTQSAPKQSQPTPDAPVPGGKAPGAADKFPFPTAAPPTMPGSEPESPGSSSGSSSSSSSSDSPDTPASDKPPLGDKGENPHPSGRRRLPKVEKLQSDEERAEEDLKVSKVYEDAGNLNAAYLRARDAVKSLPDDPETHFALAHVAEKMKKRDEAIAEYNNYLRMNPDGLKIKDAHKALSALER